jgi:serine/threonine-protein kinase
MAPEQAAGEPPDPSMDVYAMGHVLYEALAGVHAMGAPRSLANAVLWQLSEHPQPLRSLAPEVPPSLEALVHRALAKDPADRPESMLALAEALHTELSCLLAPRRRAAHNILLPGLREVALAMTQPIPVIDAPPSAPPSAPPPARSTPRSQPAVTMRSATDDARPAMLPPVPASLSAMAPAPPSARSAPAAPPASVLRDLGSLPPAELRSTDAPVESSVRRSTVTPRRAPLVGLALGAAFCAVAAASGLVFWRMNGLAGWTGGAASQPLAGSELPPSTASATTPPAAPAPAASASASASAAPCVTAPSRPAKAPARRPPPPRHQYQPPIEKPVAKGRIFGTED